MKKNNSKRIKQLHKEHKYNKQYTLLEAISIIKKTSTAKFDESFDVSLHLGIDSKKSDQNVRGSITLPHGLGRKISVAVFTGDILQIEEAKNAEADAIGLEDLANKIKKEKKIFDVIIATPESMKIVSTLGSFLGPRGIMPNPKLGTVTKNIYQAVKNAKCGLIQYKNDKNGILNCSIGKSKFSIKQIQENLYALIDSVRKNKPSKSKGIFLKKIIFSSTMGISIILDQDSLNSVKK
ncbi:50S ribosomal protein L1 [Buchnera aphidicola (Kurisakia onigurumii)]|uniref:50S ribosomal protein L1 n=1 Tax=Buchnera aphidicola TaxID=9 RepID=UPI0031B7174B